MRNILIGIAFVVSAACILVAVAHPEPTVPQGSLLGVALPSGTALFETSLQDRILPTDTSLSLVANSIQGGEALSGYNCFTIDEGRSDAEFVCGTVSGTSVTSLERGLSLLTGTTSIASLKQSHRKGANVKVADYPLIQRMRNQLSGTESIDALMTYTNTVLMTGGSPSTTLTTKYYVDNVAVAGASDANETTKGIVELATAAEGAAGTSLGDTGARLVIGTNLATSSPTAGGCPVFCIVGAVAGKIAQAALDIFTTANSWTGLQTFGGGLLATASSTFSTAPHLGSATSTLLKTDSTGLIVPAVLGTDYSGVQITYASTTIATSTGSASQTGSGTKILYATTTLQLNVPAGGFTANSTIQITGTGSCSGSAAATGAYSCGISLRNSSGAPLFTLTELSNTSATYGINAITVMNGSVSSQVTVDSQSKSSSSGSVSLSGAQTLYLVIIGQASSGSGGDTGTITNSSLSNFSIIVRP